LIFTACDGESVRGVRGPRYVLFRMGTRVLCRGGRRLRSVELLNFICDHPPPDQPPGQPPGQARGRGRGRGGEELIWFGSEYDVSFVFRDIPAQRLLDVSGKPIDVESPLEKIFAADRMKRQGFDKLSLIRGNQWTWLAFDAAGAFVGPHALYRLCEDGELALAMQIFGVKYRPKKRLIVCRGRWDAPEGWTPGFEPIPGSMRVLQDVLDFAGEGMVEFAARYGPPSVKDDLPVLTRMKNRRAHFRKLTPEIRRYNEMECRDLAATMEALDKLIRRTFGVEIKSGDFIGVGKIAAELMSRHGVVRRVELRDRFPADALTTAAQAFYMNRQEAAIIGFVGEAWTHDLNSAFAAELPRLPCLKHGRFVYASASSLQQLLMDDDAIFVCGCRFRHPPAAHAWVYCTLPIRSAQGLLSWPFAGAGRYWSDELRSAARRGAKLTLSAGWLYERTCDCQPFDWIEPLFQRRRALGAKGAIVKKTLQAIFGKLWERGGRFHNPILAGLITARIRAKLNDAVALIGEADVAMIGADAIYVRGRKAALDFGDGLGAWRAKRYGELFILMPGLYWHSRTRGAGKPAGGLKLASQGLPRKFLEPRLPALERAWARFAAKGDLSAPSPIVKVRLETFLGVKLALMRGRAKEACTWPTIDAEISFSWRDKRMIGPSAHFDGGALILSPPSGSSSAAWSPAFDNEPGLTEFQRKFDDGASERDLRVLTEELPDPLDLLPR
jgi:hypothetical protein